MAKNKNTWFKHYNDASQGHTLSVLWANNDTEAIALFWLLLELVSKFESETNRGEITISWNTIGRETGWKPTKCRRVLARIVPVSKIEINEKQTGYVSFLIPNWLELQENRGSKTSLKNSEKPDRSKMLEVRSENKELRVEEDQQLSASDFGELENVVDEETAQTPPTTNPKTTTNKREENSRSSFEIIEELRGDSTLLDEILIYVSPSVQKNWARKFDRVWLFKVLTNAAEYYMNQRKAQIPSEINDWGPLLVMWLRREKKPILGGSNELTEAKIAAWEAEIQQNEKNGHGI